VPARRDAGDGLSYAANTMIERLIQRWVKPEVQGLRAYSVMHADGLIKLDAMESPWPAPESIREEWLSALADVEVNRYPDPDSAALKSILRQCLQIPHQCQIMLGNGSDELIQLIALLVGGPGRVFISPDPSFSMYRQISVMTGTQFAGIPLNDDFSLDADKLLDAIERQQPACIFLAYPNNPTGNCFDPVSVARVLERAPGLVVLDEAYFAFCGKTWLDSIAECPNLLVLRTLSKSGFAGLRLGLLAGHPEWLGEMEKLRLPYNINVLTQASAQFFLRHYPVFERQSAQILQNRARLSEQLTQIPGVEVFPSETNFLLFRVSSDGNRVFSGLMEQGVLIKNLHVKGALLENCLRVTVGDQEENAAFVKALKSLHQ